MRSIFAWLPLVLLALGEDAALCQPSTTVQLPTYSSFGTSGSVVVPDRGSAYLGGIKRAAFGRNEFGTPLLPLRNRSFGAERSVSGASVSVYIHDFQAMDEYLLNQPTPFLRAQQEIAAGRLRRVGAPTHRHGGWLVAERSEAPEQGDWAARAGAGGPAAMSVAELRAERLRVEKTRHAEALKWLKRGQGAEAAGKANVARVYYQMAVRRATGDLKDRIAVRLKAVSGSPEASKLARNRP